MHHLRWPRRGGLWVMMLWIGLLQLGCTQSGTDSSDNMPGPGNRTVSLELVVSGLVQPVYLTHAGDEHLMVVEQAGRIRSVRDGGLLETPFLDITSLVGSGGERGLLSVAFHPDYRTPMAAGNGLFWVNYTDTVGRTIIARYRVMATDMDRADPDSARILLTIDQPFANHNGGQLQFGLAEGPEQRRYLYIGMGDGGGGGDTANAAQRDDTILGKLLRLAPSLAPVAAAPFYTVPDDNPNVGAAPPLDTIWAEGLRNPFRFSFDAAIGDLYIADVGQFEFEEVHLTLAGTPGGVNYGWRIMEGLSCFNAPQCDQTGLDLPVAVYAHDNSSRCAIIGGYVYRGDRFPALFGTYVYADFCSRELFGLDATAPGQHTSTVLLTHTSNPASFGEDVHGELYLTDFGGNVFLVTAE